MRTRNVVNLTALLSLVVALALPSCKFMTDPGTGGHVTLATANGPGGGDSTGTGNPPPPPAGLSIGVSDDSLAVAGGKANLQLFVANHDPAAATVNFRFTGPQDWPGLPATGSLTVAGNASATADVSVTVPAGTSAGSYVIHYAVDKPDGTAIQSGDFSLNVH